MKYKISTSIALTISLFLLTGCVKKTASIDAQKRTHPLMVQQSTLQLTDQDIFGDEISLNNITEEDIQTAVIDARNAFELPVNSSIILIQSGTTAPDVRMQQEMQKYYKVATFSGVPLSKRKLKSKKEGDDTDNDVNYMRALRYIAAKGRQSAIIVYWSTLELGKFDNESKSFQWTRWNKTELPAGDYALRYLTRVVLTDVSTGEWSMYYPENIEIHPVRKEGSSSDMSQKIIEDLLSQTYVKVSKDIVGRFSSPSIKY